MAEPVFVLGSAPLVHQVTDGLRYHGAAVRSWLLPQGCTPARAGELARAARDALSWAGAVGSTLVSLWTDPAVHEVLIPHVLPVLPRGCCWLQLGPHALVPAAEFHAAAAGQAVTVVHAPVTWDVACTTLYLRSASRERLTGHPLRPAVRIWLESLREPPEQVWGQRASPDHSAPPRRGDVKERG